MVVSTLIGSPSNPSPLPAAHSASAMPLSVPRPAPLLTHGNRVRDSGNSSALTLASTSTNPLPTTSGLFRWNPSSFVDKRKLPVKEKQEKIPTCTHTFVCVAATNQDSLPDGEDRAALHADRRLGRKKNLFKL